MDGETVETVSDFIFWAPKSLQMVTAAMKLKDVCSLEEKLWHPRQHIKKQRHYSANKGPSSQSYGYFSCMDVRARLWRKLSTRELMLLNCGIGEDSWESLGLQGDPTSPFWRRLTLGFLWKEWCWSWNSSTLATSCEELTHWKRLWCGEGLGAGGEEGTTEDEMAGWHHWLDGRESEWTPGVGDGQGSLECCDS